MSEPALLATYAVVAARRTAFDTMTWQVPALATAAQAFLLATALGGGAGRGARLLAALLAVALAALSAQLMTKHRRLEISDSRTAERIEQELGVDRLLGIAPNAAARERLGHGQPWWVRLSAYRLWLTGLGLFALADLTAAIAAVVSP